MFLNKFIDVEKCNVCRTENSVLFEVIDENKINESCCKIVWFAD